MPVGFENIAWRMFIIFGTLCVTAAIHVFLTYPETAGKSLEEVEFMFSKDGPHAWRTKKGGSQLDALVDEVAEAQAEKAGLGKHEARTALEPAV